MDTSKDRATGFDGGTSIRLRYSRQFQSGGHTHSIDAETALPVGASQERREQVIRELETGVEQLARQIVQRTNRPTDEIRGQAPGRASAASSSPIPMATNRTAELASAPPATTRAPVSESMPATPASSGERTIRLADFINVIKKYWEMSPQEAMKLLQVKSLDGLNYREAFNSLKALKDAEGSAPPRGPQTQPGATRPVVEAPRQPNRGAPPQTTSRPPTNQATNTQAALREVARPAPPTLPIATSEPDAREEPRREPRAGVDFAGSSRAPIPIQLGVVRDAAPRTAYKFEEEEEEDEELELPEDDEEFELPGTSSAASVKAQRKLDELKEARGNTAASAERLNVLKNVLDGQISEEQLQQIIQGTWGIATKKKLKGAQVEALISWAKEDFFADDANDLLKLLAEGEE